MILKLNKYFLRPKSSISLPEKTPPQTIVERKVQSAVARVENMSKQYSSKAQNKAAKKEAEKESMVFVDKKSQKLYLSLMAQRDNIPKRTPEQIESMKKRSSLCQTS